MKETIENKLTQLVPLKHFIVTAYARNGFFLLIKALQWDENCEIIIPAFTCPVVKKTVEEAGAMPVLVDAEERGINIDPGKVEGAITKRTRAVYVVHTYGTAAKIDEICSLAKKHDLVVIEDLAHAPFAFYKGRQLGTYGDYAVFSFTKKIINFEGGAIGTNNTSVYGKMISLQKRYNCNRTISIGGFIDRYVRLVGSWWETKFSLIALLLMKLNDVINRIIYRGAYGIAVNEGGFGTSRLGDRLTLGQLDSLYRTIRNDGGMYRDYADRCNGRILLPEIGQVGSDTYPHYFTGIIDDRDLLYKLISFRTWRNFNEPERFPRADYLFKRFRIFSKTVMRLL